MELLSMILQYPLLATSNLCLVMVRRDVALQTVYMRLRRTPVIKFGESARDYVLLSEDAA